MKVVTTVEELTISNGKVCRCGGGMEKEQEKERREWRLKDRGRKGCTWKHPTSMKPKAARTPTHIVKTLRHRIPRKVSK